MQLAGVFGAENFIRQTNFASGPALHKEILRAPGFLNLQGEFGRKLKGMADEYNAPMQAMRTVMTDVYAKRYYEGKGYSDAEKSVMGVEWPAFSFLGETTPGTFLESLTPDMMEDGFMSRFLVISHAGLRPQPNEAQAIELEPQEAPYWKALVSNSVKYQTPMNMPEPVTTSFRNDDAYDKLKRFELECIECINASDDESERQMYNRAHLKALKIANLLAVADNFYKPAIDLGHATWGITAVRMDMAVFQRRKEAGEIGNDDHARLRQLAAWMRGYLTTRPVPAGYKIPDAMRESGIVPRKYLQNRTSSSRPFVNHKLGANNALDAALRNMLDNGYIMEVDKNKMVESHSFHGKCYRVLSLPS